jgi:hypothetical protein
MRQEIQKNKDMKDYIMPDTFKPSPHLKNRYIQTILASSRLRVKGTGRLEKNEKKVVFEVAGGIKLYGLYSAQKNARGIVILLHGWEGSSGSTYIKHTGRYLYENGYAVFRLNYRDHGDSHHLNEGLFYAALLDEVYDGIRQAAMLEPGLPAFIIGFSLGGNFALRTAVRNTVEPILNLKHVVSVSPGLMPFISTDAIDKDWLLRKYFLRKWRKSLRKKERLFPEIYDFKDIMKIKKCIDLTDALLKNFSDYPSLSDHIHSGKMLFNQFPVLRQLLPPKTIR